jgi:hypothetical protein
MPSTALEKIRKVKTHGFFTKMIKSFHPKNREFFVNITRCGGEPLSIKIF